MEKSDLRIETRCLHRGNGLLGEQEIQEGKQRVHPTSWRPAFAGVESEITAIHGDEVPKDAEVSAGSISFVSAEAVHVPRLLRRQSGRRQPFDRCGERGGGGITKVASPALKESPAVADLPQHHLAGQRQGRSFVKAGLHLGNADVDVALGGPTMRARNRPR
jgi:hypothetical protein